LGKIPYMRLFYKYTRDLKTNISRPITSHLWIYLIENSRRNNTFVSNRIDLAKGMQISISTLSVGVKELKELDLVRKVDQKTYMINPNYVSNGDDKMDAILHHEWGKLKRART